jgi:hypothetical protein
MDRRDVKSGVELEHFCRITQGRCALIIFQGIYEVETNQGKEHLQLDPCQYKKGCAKYVVHNVRQGAKTHVTGKFDFLLLVRL